MIRLPTRSTRPATLFPYTTLFRSGLSVALVDRAAFPRDKPCGGGVLVRAARLLPFSISPVAERTAFGVRFSFRQKRRSEEHPSELQSLMRISYAVFCLEKKKTQQSIPNRH